MASVYKITNQIDGKVYIGETTRTIAARWSQHKSRAKKPEYTEYLYNAIRKYGIDNFTIEEITKCADEDRFKIETEYITQYRSWVGFEDCNGYNLTLSQEGVAPIMAQEILNCWNDGLTIVQISERLHINVKTISLSLKNNDITQEQIFERRRLNSGKNSRKPVIQYDMNGEYINKYASISEAARAMNKTSPSQIQKSCAGKISLTAYGYIWQYEDDDNIEEIVAILKTKNKKGVNKKAIQQFDLDGNFIQEYESASAAGRAFGKAHTAFAKAARENRVAYGYKWEYVN
jgi:group I intron endonuclease